MLEKIPTALLASRTQKRTTDGQYSTVRLELATLVSKLLYGTRAMLVFNLQAFESKTYTTYDRFYRNGLYGDIPTKEEPIRTLGLNSRLSYHLIELYHTMLKQKILPVQPLIQCEAGRAKTKIFVPLGLKMAAA